MDTGIPNLRNALARQTAQSPHPDADLLNAYAHRALSTAEDTQVAGHLATCADCRHVLFLAHSAADVPGEVAETTPVSRPLTWWRWAMPVTAALAIAGTVVVMNNTDLRTRNLPALRQTTMADKVSTLPASGSRDSGVAVGQAESVAKSAEAKRSPAGHAKTRSALAQKTLPKQALSEKPDAPLPSLAANTPMMAAAPAPAPTPTGGADAKGAHSMSMATSPPGSGPSQRIQNPSMANAQAASETVDTAAVDRKAAPLSAAPKPVFKTEGVGALAYTDADVTVKRSALSRMASQIWRISSDGHLERMIQNQWHRALNSVQKSFRVVAYVQDHVWAGGNGPELFHSADGGENWNTLKVKTADSELNGAMQTIRASDSQHLSIVADDGSTWVTADGGQTWAKQQ